MIYHDITSFYLRFLLVFGLLLSDTCRYGWNAEYFVSRNKCLAKSEPLWRILMGKANLQILWGFVDKRCYFEGRNCQFQFTREEIKCSLWGAAFVEIVYYPDKLFQLPSLSVWHLLFLWAFLNDVIILGVWRQMEKSVTVYHEVNLKSWRIQSPTLK